MITEAEYLFAIKIINQYSIQIKNQSDEVLKKTGALKTPNQLRWSQVDFFPNMSIRLLNILVNNFADKRICDITRSEFLSARLAGNKSWNELCDYTGKNNT